MVIYCLSQNVPVLRRLLVAKQKERNWRIIKIHNEDILLFNTQYQCYLIEHNEMNCKGTQQVTMKWEGTGV